MKIVESSKAEDFKDWKAKLSNSLKHTVNKEQPSGVYIVRDKNDNIVYVGSGKICQRIDKLTSRNRKHNCWDNLADEHFGINEVGNLNEIQLIELDEMIQGYTYSFIELPKSVAREFEQYLITNLKPLYNRQGK